VPVLPPPLPQPVPSLTFTDQQLLERVGDYSSNSFWAKDDTDHSIIYDVPWQQTAQALAYFLGVEWMKADYSLGRTTPMRHPRYSYLYASRVSDLVAVKLARKNVGTAPTLGYGGLTYKPHQEYTLERLTVEFRMPAERYFTDEQVKGNIDIWTQSQNPVKRTIWNQREWLRWCTYSRRPYGEMLTVEGQEFRFAEGPYGPIETQGKPIPFPGGIGFPIAKAGIVIRWRHVPRIYVARPAPESLASLDPFAGGPGTMPNIEQAANKVNAFDFLGYKAGTLLAEPVEIEDVVSPVQFGPAPMPLCNLTITLRHFDPPKGVWSSPYRGHQLVPGADGKWYLATRGADGDPGNPKQYQEYPFAYLFLPPYGETLNPLTYLDDQATP
jgi:hypothetical protein